MTPGQQDARARHLIDLTEEECWELVATRDVGRLAWQGSAGLTVVPVNYRAGGGEVLLRTAAYSAAARECDDSPVAFQVDAVEPTTRSGWSVLLRGRAHLDHVGPDDDVDTWPAGSRPLVVRIEATEVTGRRLPPAAGDPAR
ncbi:pyridoxamine 5'-phosphate oxidase family protein [Nocardioides sp. 1609]|uniref:pyridoxamine 5'-phosphate oxidase family protein n=1 Tax=Nocardioides sp. 1609 TaxID=2508327 RepID=UPI0010700BF2|nr:pyridoxamine 5'-phosphate oxidase family protein [Nocardioides sp. 1609]